MRIKWKRGQAGFYYSNKPIKVQGVQTYAVIEDCGSFWTLLLEQIPGMTTRHKSLAHARFALADLIEGGLDLIEA